MTDRDDTPSTDTPDVVDPAEVGPVPSEAFGLLRPAVPTTAPPVDRGPAGEDAVPGRAAANGAAAADAPPTGPRLDAPRPIEAGPVVPPGPRALRHRPPPPGAGDPPPPPPGSRPYPLPPPPPAPGSKPAFLPPPPMVAAAALPPGADAPPSPPAPPPPPVAREPKPPRPPAPRRSRGPAKPVRAGTRVFFVLVGALVLVPTLGWGTLAVANSLGHTTETTSLTFPGSVHEIHAETTTGSIRVRGSERDDISVQRVVDRSIQSPTLREHVDGSRLDLQGLCSGTAIAWCQVSYVIDAPRGTRVSVQSATGSLTVTAIDGEVDARSGAGSVDLDRIGGHVRAESGAGSVRGTALTTGVVDATAGAGSVRLEFDVAPMDVRAHAGAGSVDVEVPRGEETYRVDNSGGHNRPTVTVATDRDSTRRIDVSAGGGSVRVHYP